MNHRCSTTRRNDGPFSTGLKQICHMLTHLSLIEGGKGSTGQMSASKNTIFPGVARNRRSKFMFLLEFYHKFYGFI